MPAFAGMTAESSRTSSLRVLSGHEARRSSLAFLAHQGMRNAGRFTAPAAPRVVDTWLRALWVRTRCVPLRVTRSLASLHRLDQDGLGNRNTLRSAHNELFGLQFPAASRLTLSWMGAGPGIRNPCGHEAPQQQSVWIPGSPP